MSNQIACLVQTATTGAELPTPVRPDVLEEMMNPGTNQARASRGLAKLTELDGQNGKEIVARMGDLGRYIVEFGFGDIYSRPGLSLRDREMTAVAMLVAMGGRETQVRFHLSAALRIGLTAGELEEVIIQTVPLQAFRQH
jgi:4-carboxymuconolactone decarboxylase